MVHIVEYKYAMKKYIAKGKIEKGVMELRSGRGRDKHESEKSRDKYDAVCNDSVFRVFCSCLGR